MNQAMQSGRPITEWTIEEIRARADYLWASGTGSSYGVSVSTETGREIRTLENEVAMRNIIQDSTWTPPSPGMPENITIRGRTFSTGHSIFDLGSDPNLDGLGRWRLVGHQTFNPPLTNEDIVPLAYMSNLTRLSLDGQNITDLSPLAGLTNLTHISFNGTNVADLSPLAGLTNLTHISFNETNVTDLTPLAGLVNLVEIEANGNNITNIAPLAGLANLRGVDLRLFTRITDTYEDGSSSWVETAIDNHMITNWMPVDHVYRVSGRPQGARTETPRQTPPPTSTPTPIAIPETTSVTITIPETTRSWTLNAEQPYILQRGANAGQSISPAFETRPFSDVNGQSTGQTTVFVPADFIADLGWNLNWDNSQQTATFTVGGTTIIFTNGQSTATVDGQQWQMTNADGSPAAAFMSNNRLMLPLAFFGEGSGLQVLTYTTETR